jgi:hypothetical protein
MVGQEANLAIIWEGEEVLVQLEVLVQAPKLVTEVTERHLQLLVHQLLMLEEEEVHLGIHLWQIKEQVELVEVVQEFILTHQMQEQLTQEVEEVVFMLVPQRLQDQVVQE